ncbi:hypothetical protein AB0912_23980 [Streptomyces sp. NPDC007084]|uniref:hypothetical protein n=1 Tax=Streptomyces sp. NPDC007084 TaxID=3154313 RepID=UPI00345540C1
MSDRSVVVQPTRRAGRQVWVDGKHAGTVRGLHGLTELLRRSGRPDLDEVDAADLPVVEWPGGGPETWSVGSGIQGLRAPAA